MMMITWLSFVCLFFALQYIADITFAAMTKKNFSPRNFKFFLDIAIFFIFLVNINVVFVRNLGGTIREGYGVVTWEEKSVIYCKNYVENWVKETNLLIIGIVALWIRVLNFTRYNEHLGRFLGVVKRLIPELSLFFILYLVNLMIFSGIAESAFPDLEEYNLFIVAFKTLFYASYGSFNCTSPSCLPGETIFERIEQAQISKNFGISFLIFFLIINIGLFMSLFVAIITVLFQMYSKHD
jgi:hypothetical protein